MFDRLRADQHFNGYVAVHQAAWRAEWTGVYFLRPYSLCFLLRSTAGKSVRSPSRPRGGSRCPGGSGATLRGRAPTRADTSQLFMKRMTSPSGPISGPCGDQGPGLRCLPSVCRGTEAGRCGGDGPDNGCFVFTRAGFVEAVPPVDQETPGQTEPHKGLWQRSPVAHSPQSARPQTYST
ncbi:unnamed protein product [Gadus morhua 'NCC']